jgi:hypothetical protein
MAPIIRPVIAQGTFMAKSRYVDVRGMQIGDRWVSALLDMRDNPSTRVQR